MTLHQQLAKALRSAAKWEVKRRAAEPYESSGYVLARNQRDRFRKLAADLQIQIALRGLPDDFGKVKP